MRNDGHEEPSRAIEITDITGSYVLHDGTCVPVTAGTQVSNSGQVTITALLVNYRESGGK